VALLKRWVGYRRQQWLCVNRLLMMEASPGDSEGICAQVGKEEAPHGGERGFRVPIIGGTWIPVGVWRQI
jgi:hypothetical protein